MPDNPPLLRCSCGEACVHPDGPDLPMTAEYFHRRSKGSASGFYRMCKACRRIRDHSPERAAQIRQADRERYARRRKQRVTIPKNEKEARLAALIAATPRKENGLYRNYWEWEQE